MNKKVLLGLPLECGKPNFIVNKYCNVMIVNKKCEVISLNDCRLVINSI